MQRSIMYRFHQFLTSITKVNLLMFALLKVYFENADSKLITKVNLLTFVWVKRAFSKKRFPFGTIKMQVGMWSQKWPADFCLPKKVYLKKLACFLCKYKADSKLITKVNLLTFALLEKVYFEKWASFLFNENADSKLITKVNLLTFVWLKRAFSKKRFSF